MSINTAQQQNDLEKKHIEAVLFSLMKELQKLAPHPDKPKSTGADFVQTDSAYEPAADYDGLLGSLIIEGTLGGAFGAAAAGVNWGDAVECVSEYMQDRPAAQARAPYSIGQKRSISAAFNTSGTHTEMMGSYLRDLPRRLGIERWLSDYQRKLYATHKHAALGLAA